MIRKSTESETNRTQLEMVTLDELVPADHLVRKIEAVIDFEFIYPLVEDLYSEDRGRPSVDPVVLIKMAFLQYLFGIRSMRQTIREIETNVAYRWFLGFGFTDKVPHFSTFGKNYVRRFQYTSLFDDIFYHILEQAVDAGFIDRAVLFVDSTHVKANANKRKLVKKTVRQEVKYYQEQLDAEVERDREESGKKPLGPKKNQAEETKEIKVSTTDPESGYYVKSEREKQFAYSVHAASDAHGFVLGAIVTPGNVHDSLAFPDLLDKVSDRLIQPFAVAADSAYKNPAIAKLLIDRGILPVFPYTRPKGMKGAFKTKDFIYDEHHDVYICPNNELLTYSTTMREGKRKYVSNPAVCVHCPLLEQCTKSQKHQRIIERHLWQPYMDEVEDLRHTELNRNIYDRRKQTVERVFADAKEKHGMRWTRYRGLEKVSMQAMLTFAALNLKKMAGWAWKNAQPA
ncbi:IS1182 family transposase [Exiguobacterium alkaliphilum]|uniref:IS1182 family transposase n=1 Tax=Exiguobacterium alkaliphilum TaxID=1428684 RepID=UPI00403B0987